MSSEIKHVYQLKITLDEIKPPVWRRVLVSDKTTLDQWQLNRILSSSDSGQSPLHFGEETWEYGLRIRHSAVIGLFDQFGVFRHDA